MHICMARVNVESIQSVTTGDLNVRSLFGQDANFKEFALSWRAYLIYVILLKMGSSEGRLNIKMLSYQYRDPHVKDKTVSRSSYL